MPTNSELPPGPKMPAALQTLGFWSRPIAFLEGARARYGPRFTIRLLGSPPFVMLCDPREIEEVFKAPPEVLHPGEGARVLEPVLGRHSVILLDEGPHLEQRKLLLPAFHGERMAALSGLIEQLAAAEVASWPEGETVALHPRLQRLTLEIILRAVFGLERGAQLDRLRDLLTTLLAFAESPLSLLPPPPDSLASRWPIKRLLPDSSLERVDRLMFELIEERRAAGGEGEDVLALLLRAQHEDGTPMSDQELRDELLTALVAGHETTASQLAWAFERLSREPAVTERLRRELEEGAEEEYLTATVYEIMRHRPVLPNPEPRLVKRPVEIGGFSYPPGVALVASAYLLHHDPDIYPQPYALRPERFLGTAPGTYTWIPFGGGRRRCLGANFAMLEMKVVLRAALRRHTLHPTSASAEPARRRSITISPASESTVMLTPRPARGQPAPAGRASGRGEQSSELAGSPH
jgi:cytochrome P450